MTTGGKWPASSDVAPTGDVIFLSAEDDVADTLRPRLEAAGADISKVHVLEAITEAVYGDIRNFDLRSDLSVLEDMMEKIGNVALIVIDPITAYLGKTDDHKNADVRALLHALSNLAARHNVAIVCISHQNKGGNGQKALMRIMGSVAFVAAVRAAFLIVKDKNDPDLRLFLPTKNNLGSDKTGLSFRIEAISLADGIETSRIVWDKEVSISADAALSDDGEGAYGGALQEAEEFLAELLREGPVQASEVKIGAKSAGISNATLRRAQVKLGIKPGRDGFGAGGAWTWQLPSKVFTATIDVQSKEVNVLDEAEHVKAASPIGVQVLDEHLTEEVPAHESIREKIDRIEKRMNSGA